MPGEPLIGQTRVATCRRRRETKEKLVAYRGKLVTVQEPLGEAPNGSGFVITLGAAPGLDATNLVVGRVVGGMDLVSGQFAPQTPAWLAANREVSICRRHAHGKLGMRRRRAACSVLYPVADCEALQAHRKGSTVPAASQGSGHIAVHHPPRYPNRKEQTCRSTRIRGWLGALGAI